MLKSESGGAWQSYVLRRHWRMIFPISCAHQARTFTQITATLQKNVSPVVHLVKFPSLTINHGMILFGVAKSEAGWAFSAYDPNDPAKPARLIFDPTARTFSLPSNHYWAGGELNLIEIWRNWLM